MDPKLCNRLRDTVSGKRTLVALTSVTVAIDHSNA